MIEPHNHFDYHSDGQLTWKEGRPGVRKGSVAGCLSNGYIAIGVNRKVYYAHRIIFEMVHGYVPSEIDHINGDRTDNRIENLRECSSSQNQMNRKTPTHNTSGHKNVRLDKRSGKWFAQVKRRGKVTTRVAKSKEDAIDLAEELRQELHGDYASGI